MNRHDCIAFVTPFLIGAAMLFCTTCGHAQTPPVENQMAGLLDWRVVLKQSAVSSVVAPPVPTPRPLLRLDYRTGPHWCQTPDNTAFYFSKDLVNWTLYTGTNPFTADDSLRLFIAWHWCHAGDTNGQQCEVRFTRL